MTHQAQHKSNWRTRLQLAVLVAAGLACGAALAQKIDDVPPAVANNVAPNFMFMIDNSQSMQHIVPETPFNAGTTYLPTCPTGSTISNTLRIDLGVVSGVPRIVAVGTGGGTFRHTTAAAPVPASPDDRRCFNPTATYRANLTTGLAGGTVTANYLGNYLNWYFGTYAPDNLLLSSWTDRKRLSSTSTVRNRIQVAKAAATTVVNGLPLPAPSTAPAPLRVGLSTYDSGAGGAFDADGGTLLVPVTNFTATQQSAMLTGISGLALLGSTPLATTLADIGGYFATGATSSNVQPNSVVGGASVTIADFLRQDGRTSCLANSSGTRGCTSTRPITQWCQRSYAVLLTDGRPNGDQEFTNNTYLRDYDRDCTTTTGTTRNACKAGGVSSGANLSWDRKAAQSYEASGSDYLDDVAKALRDIDLRPDLQPPLLPDGSTRKNTDGTTFNKSAQQPNNLVTYAIGFADTDAINDPLLRRTAEQGGGSFETADNATELVDSFNKIITDALAKDASSAAVAVTNAQITAGSVGYASSYQSGSWYGDLEAYSLDLSTGLQTGATEWSARLKLNGQSATSRKIASFNGTAGVAFTDLNASSFPAITAISPMTAAGVINWVRGDRTGEGTTYRARTNVLGDIINAEPVVVNYPTGTVVFQAANDGMLHAFDGRVESTATTRGQELWAYVPRLIHSKLDDLADPNYQHQYYVDGTPATAEITVAGITTRILVGGLGKGGAGYYALDITSGAAADEAAAVAKVKWEFNPANMGYSFGTPLIVNTSTGWKVVVASGYRNDTASGGLGGDGRGRVWVLNPDGTLDKTFVTPTGYGSASDSLGLAHLSKLANTAADYTHRYVYGGDLKGNVWRFDLDAAGGNAVRIASLTAPNGSAQPVAAAPVVGPVSGSTTKFYVYVGTGQYFSVEDVPGAPTATTLATQQQTMYGIIDDTTVASPTMPTRSSSGCTNGGDGTLVCQQATQATASSNFTATANALDPTTKRGFYLDVPIANGRVNNQPSLTTRGTLVYVVNEPTYVLCDPGGNSYFFQLSAANGGAVPRTLGGSTYFDAGFRLAYALSSRAVLITTSGGTRGLFRLGNKTTESKPIDETAPGSTPAAYKRIYKRALN